ncbi:MAG: pectin methylesterase [Spirochaetes bacterium]|nr:pectin methylesterase [Spirochaetota bacterium]
MIVSKDSSGDFDSIQKAIDSISDKKNNNIEIFIKNGTYYEKIFIDKPFIKLIGEDKDKTIITYNDNAFKTFPDGSKYLTFNSYSFFIGRNNFIAENLTFENSSGNMVEVGQAIAVYSDGDKISFKNCNFLGNQDTLFVGPLPPYPIIPGSFSGPRENHTRINTFQYFENCFIKGDIDFIFGSATAVFNRCEIFSINKGKMYDGFITAASTPKNKEFGFVFLDCRLISDSDHPSVYLGRPWRQYAKTVYINCFMGAHIKPEGWDNWQRPENEKSVFFGEYNSSGPGGKMANRVKWAKILTDKEAKKYNINNIFKEFNIKKQ